VTGSPMPEQTPHPGLLVQIMSNTLDQDYQAAAERAARGGAVGVDARDAGGRHRRSGRAPLVLGVVLGVFGLMVGVSALRTQQDRPLAAAERSQLVDEIHARQHRLDAMHAQLSELDGSIASLQEEAGDARTAQSRINGELSGLSGVTGVGAVAGPGIHLVADDAPGALGSTAGGVILDTDLQALVNGLWQAGAEAVAINGQRLTVLSAIRDAGRAITVGYRSLRPPYRIDAVGDPNTLPARLQETAGGQAWLDLQRNFGIRLSIAESTNLQLPGSPAAAVRVADSRIRP
jgi:uncharacterized protein YlxW (UPF0749 family)